MNQKTLTTIQRICRKLAPKYTFGYYSAEDIEQEAFIMALTALPYFNSEISSLETFLYIHLNNKLKTFKRDHYFRKDFTCAYCHRQDPTCEYCQKREWKHAAKKHLMEPVDIDNVNSDSEKNMSQEADFLADVELQELLTIINQNLPLNLREDYLRMTEGISIPKQRKQAIETSICSILEDTGYYHGK